MAKKKKPDHVADTGGKPWTGMPHIVMESEAYLHLSVDARAVFFEIVYKFNGSNNGKIGIGYREIAKRLNRRGFHFIAPAITELMEHGFLDLSMAHSWKDKRVREYRLTFISTGANGHRGTATNDYRRWSYDPAQVKRKSTRKGKFSAGNVETGRPFSVGDVETAAPRTVGNVDTGGDGNPQFPSK